MLRPTELIFMAVYLLPTVLALGDILRTSTDAWAAAKQNQVLWTVLVLLLPIVGPVLYVFMARPKLNQSS